jgi:hypothetical protein
MVLSDVLFKSSSGANTTYDSELKRQRGGILQRNT